MDWRAHKNTHPAAGHAGRVHFEPKPPDRRRSKSHRAFCARHCQSRKPPQVVLTAYIRKVYGICARKGA